MFRAGERVVVAVSGGPDSLCLLHCLHELAGALHITLHVAHVHHGLRGAEADADAAFVDREARSLGLANSVLHVDTLGHAAASRLSQETAARNLRYLALRALAEELGADCLAIGHTEDDQAETLLLHLLRGSGLDGLAAMRPRRGDLARPLLCRPRSSTEEFCRDRGLAARYDSTNSDLGFKRNALRLEVLPMLDSFNPRARSALARCAATLAADADYLRERAEEALESVLAPGETDSGVALRLEPLTALPQALRSRVWRLAVACLWGEGSALSAERMADLESLLGRPGTGRSIDLGQGFRATRTADAVILGPDRTAAVAPEPVVLPIPGSVVFGSWRLDATVLPISEVHDLLRAPQSVLKPIAYLDRSALAGDVLIRARRPGDRLRPLGLRGSKKVQDIMVDRKVPLHKRAGLPLVTTSSGIVWVVGLTMGSAAAVKESTKEVVRIAAMPSGDGIAEEVSVC